MTTYDPLGRGEEWNTDFFKKPLPLPNLDNNHEYRDRYILRDAWNHFTNLNWYKMVSYLLFWAVVVAMVVWALTAAV